LIFPTQPRLSLAVRWRIPPIVEGVWKLRKISWGIYGAWWVIVFRFLRRYNSFIYLQQLKRCNNWKVSKLKRQHYVSEKRLPLSWKIQWRLVKIVAPPLQLQLQQLCRFFFFQLFGVPGARFLCLFTQRSTPGSNRFLLRVQRFMERGGWSTSCKLLE
jgi:hypothetical protein